MLKTLSVFFFIVIISGCNDKNDVKSDSGAKTETLKTDTSSDNSGKDSLLKGTDTLSAAADSVIRTFEGIYVLNLTENIFTDCRNPDSTYWVTDDTKNLKPLYEKIYSMRNIYGAVYAKLKGEIVETKDKIGKNISEKYPKTLVVKEVLDIDKKNFRNTCLKYDFWALGNEPNWSLQISKSENLIEFIDYSQDQSYYFFYEEPRIEPGKIIYITHNNIQQYIIDIIIKEEKCSDTMSDIVYDYSVEVVLSGGKSYKGCGIKGKE